MTRWVWLFVLIAAGLFLLLTACGGPNEVQDLQDAHKRAEVVYQDTITQP